MTGVVFQVGEQELETVGAVLDDLAQACDVEAQGQSGLRPRSVVELASTQNEQVAQHVGLFVELRQCLDRASVLGILVHRLTKQFACEPLVDRNGQFASARAQGMHHMVGDGQPTRLQQVIHGTTNIALVKTCSKVACQPHGRTFEAIGCAGFATSGLACAQERRCAIEQVDESGTDEIRIRLLPFGDVESLDHRIQLARHQRRDLHQGFVKRLAAVTTLSLGQPAQGRHMRGIVVACAQQGRFLPGRCFVRCNGVPGDALLHGASKGAGHILPLCQRSRECLTQDFQTARRIASAACGLFHDGQEIRNQRASIEGLGQSRIDRGLPNPLQTGQTHDTETRAAVGRRSLEGLLRANKRRRFVIRFLLEELSRLEEELHPARGIECQGSTGLLDRSRCEAELAGRCGQAQDLAFGLQVVRTKLEDIDVVGKRLAGALGALLFELGRLAVDAHTFTIACGQDQPVRENGEEPKPIVGSIAAAYDSLDGGDACRLIFSQDEQGIAQPLGARINGQGAGIPSGSSLGIGQLFLTGIA